MRGLANRASLVTLAFSQCPDTQVVMSGYSQGAQVVHDAAADLPAATMDKVGAVVTFGDPGLSHLFFFFFFWVPGCEDVKVADFPIRQRHRRYEHRRQQSLDNMSRWR